MFPVFRDFLLLSLVLLSFLGFDFGEFLRGERLKICRIFAVSLSASGTESVSLCPELVPAKTTDLKLPKLVGNLFMVK